LHIFKAAGMAACTVRFRRAPPIISAARCQLFLPRAANCFCRALPIVSAARRSRSARVIHRHRELTITLLLNNFQHFSFGDCHNKIVVIRPHPQPLFCIFLFSYFGNMI